MQGSPDALNCMVSIASGPPVETGQVEKNPRGLVLVRGKEDSQKKGNGSRVGRRGRKKEGREESEGGEERGEKIRR